MENVKRTDYFEWACRILLTIHATLGLIGYSNYIQTKNELLSPLIPRSTVMDVAEPNLYTSLYIGILFVPALWFYFLKMRAASAITSGIGIIAYKFILIYFTN